MFEPKRNNAFQIMQLAKEQTTLRPEWGRVPQATQFFEIGRTKLYEWITAGKIKSTSLKERGQVRGTRLISFDSLAAYIETHSTGG
jgi:hypothetical protein